MSGVDVQIPGWRKQIVGPQALVWLSTGAGLIPIALVIGLLFTYGEAVSGYVGGSAIFAVIALPILTVLGGMLGLSCRFVGRKATALITQHRKATALINQIVTAEGQVAFPASEPLCLYLRSFAASQAFAWRRNLRSLWKRIEAADDPEEDLKAALRNRCTFLAIGNKYDAQGALKIHTTGAKWEQIFQALAERATVIFCFVGPTPSSMLEIAQILSNDALFEKTAFIIPPGIGEGFQSRIQSEWAKLNVALPHYSDDGAVFRPARGREYMQTTPYAQMMKVIADVDLAANDAQESIWKASPYYKQSLPLPVAD